MYIESSKMPSIRRDIALILLILLAFNSGVRLLKNGLDRSPEALFSHSLHQEGRLKNLRSLLPPRGLVGFAQDTSLENVEKLREFYLTQYALAPLILVQNGEETMEVANFKDDLSLKRWLAGKNFGVLKDDGNGVAILQKRGKE